MGMVGTSDRCRIRCGGLCVAGQPAYHGPRTPHRTCPDHCGFYHHRNGRTGDRCGAHHASLVHHEARECGSGRSRSDRWAKSQARRGTRPDHGPIHRDRHLLSYVLSYSVALALREGPRPVVALLAQPPHLLRHRTTLCWSAPASRRLPRASDRMSFPWYGHRA